MDAAQLRALIEGVRQGRVPRRAFIARMAAFGLAAPFASQLLAQAGVPATAAPFAYKPTRAGGGGTLRLLLWQGPTQLNPHFATGLKDGLGAKLFYESLTAFDSEGSIVPILAAAIPSRENGGISADGRTITCRLKQGVTWHDGKPFTADDVVFNWRYAGDPATAATSISSFTGYRAEKVDDHTVRFVFDKPATNWTRALNELLLPRHVFEPFMGTKSRDAPANYAPVGTGPYRFTDFKPGDQLRGVRNPNYHLPNRPHFDSVDIKGGGDPSSAARAVLQTGEYDFAWNLQVEDDVLRRMEDSGRGVVHHVSGADIEFVQLNVSDPWTEVEGERANPRSRHFAFGDPAVRRAMPLLVDRDSMEKFVYGRGGKATPNYLNAPAAYRSPNNRIEFNPEKASAMLDAAGWKRGGDGLREKGGRKMKLVFQTSTSGVRQKEQAIVKQVFGKAGIEVELKAVTASVFFSTDLGNPDTNGKFWADMQMFTASSGSPDPEQFMNRFTGPEVSSKANKWQGRNLNRWRSEDFDRLHEASKSELDPVKRAALFIQMNDLVVRDGATIPLIHRTRASGASLKLKLRLTAWDNEFAFIHDWYRDG